MTSWPNETAQLLTVRPQRTSKSATRMLRLPRVLDDWLIAYAHAYGYRSVPELIVQTVREFRAKNQLQLNAATALEDALPDNPQLPFEPLA